MLRWLSPLMVVLMVGTCAGQEPIKGLCPPTTDLVCPSDSRIICDDDEKFKCWPYDKPLPWQTTFPATQVQEVPKAQHPLLYGFLVQGPPQPDNEGEAFAFHYRCTAGKDGTTITLQAIEGGPKVKIACINCSCGGEK